MKLYFIILIFFTACSIKEPNINQEQIYNEPKYYKIYKNKTLEKLINQALNKNLEIQSKQLDINKSLYLLRSSKSDLMPSFSANLNGGISKNIKNSNESKNFGSSLSLSYELDFWDKVKDKINAQSYEYQASIEDLKHYKNNIINEVIDNFLNISYINDSKKIILKNIKTQTELSDIINFKARHGKVDKLELDQAKQSIISLENNLLEANSKEINIRKNLKNLLSKQNLLDYKLKNQSLENIRLKDINISSLELRHRADIKASELRLKASFSNFSSIQKSLYPSLSIGSSLNANSSRIKDTFNFSLLEGNIRINLPFLDYEKVKNNIKISKTQYEQNKLNFTNTLSKAINELNANIKIYDIQRQIYKNNIQNLKTQEKITKYYKLRYKVGKNPLSDYLNAYNTELILRLNLIYQKYLILQTMNLIYKSIEY